MVFHRIISNYVCLAQPAIHIAWLEIKTSLVNGVVFVSLPAISSVRKDVNIITLRRMNFWFPETLFSKKLCFLLQNLQVQIMSWYGHTTCSSF